MRFPLRGLAGVIGVACCVWSVPAHATNLALGLEVGATRPDPQFQKYDWVRTVQPGLGAFLAVEQSRVSIALRAYATENRQRTDTPAVHIDSRVRWYAAEIAPRVRVLGSRTLSLWAGVGLGRMRLEYAPDRVEVEIPGTGETTAVHFAPIEDWTASAGGTLRVDTVPGWSFGLGLDHHWYRLDAMERAGDAVIRTHPDLAQWDLRASIARRFGI